MKTKVLQPTQLQEAASILRQGGLVVFPTETVYGLGANGLDTFAVNKIFMAKGRPSDNPLILHIHDKNQLESLVTEIPTVATQLMDAFWPGPLTLVFEKKEIVPSNVTAGLSTVAIRMPNHEVALNLLRQLDMPLAAPSANLSGRPSSTKLDHVLEDLNGNVDAVIDGGASVIGIESTVLDVTTNPPTLLRPGHISKAALEAVIKQPIQGAIASETPKSPGMKYQHYQPQAKVYWRCGDKSLIYQEISTLPGKIGVIEHPSEHELYAQLRKHDNLGVDAIVIITVAPSQLGEGLLDRLTKASFDYQQK